GDDADDRADDVQLEDVAGADRAGDDSADDRTADSEQHRHQHADVLTAGHDQPGDDPDDDPDDYESEYLHGPWLPGRAGIKTRKGPGSGSGCARLWKGGSCFP